MQSLTDWLFSEAGAGWVFGLVSSAALIVSLFRRKKPNRLVVNELHNARMVNIHEEVEDKVRLTYSGEPIEILGQVKIEIFNEGTIVIKKAEISCSLLPEDTKILDIFPISSLSRENFPAEVNFNENKATLKLPFVNPYREHGHVIKLLISVDGEVETTRFEGAGDGWSVRHIPLLTERQKSRLVILSSVVLVGSAGISIITGKLLGINFNRINLTTTLLMLPAFIGGVISIYLYAKSLYRKERFLNTSS